jgi:CRP-like cAMP-binding protein
MSLLTLNRAYFCATYSQTFKSSELIPLSHCELWKIERGAVRTLTWNDRGTVITLGLWGEGDIIGKPLSTIEPYEVECLTPVQASVVPPDRWNSLFDVLLEHAQQVEKLMLILRHERVKTRLQHFLALLADKFGAPVERGKLIVLRLSHQGIAEVLGTSRVTVTRILQDLQKEGSIERKGRDLIWRDRL